MGQEGRERLLPLGVTSARERAGPMVGPVTITKADDGKTVGVRVGDSLLLQLLETPGSGYRWDFARRDEGLLAVEDSGYRGHDDRPGSGGVATWTLRARAPGKTRLELKRWRHWEGDRSIVERFSVTVEIKSA